MDEPFGASLGQQYVDSGTYQAPPTATLPPPYTPAAAPAPTPQPQQGGGIIPTLVSAREAELGRRLDPNELLDLGAQAKVQHVIPDMLRKGVPEFQVKAMGDAFDSMFQQYADAYSKQGVPTAATGANGETADSGGVVNNAIQTAGSIVAGAVDLIGGLAGLADYGVRTAGAVKRNLENRGATGESINDIMSKPVRDIMADYGASPTIVGNIGRSISEGAQGIREATYTPGTLNAQAKLGELIDTGSTKDVVKHIIDNPALIATMAGEMTAGLGATKLATKLPKFAAALEKLGEGGKLARMGQGALAAAPSGVAYAGQQAMQFEDQIRNSSLDELVKSPRNKALYDIIVDSGYTGDAAVTRLKDMIIGHGLDTVLAASLVANVVLPGVPGLGGAERVVAGAAAKKGLIRVGLSEAGQEGLAGGLEQLGTNVASGADPGKSVAAQGAIGAIVGGLVGSATGATHRRGLKKPLPNVDAGAAAGAGNTPPATPGATPGATPNTPPPDAPTGPTFSDTPVADFDTKVKPQVLDLVKEDTAATKVAKSAATSADLITLSENVAEHTANDAGTPWATLSRDQQVDIVESVAENLNNSRGSKKLKDLGEAIVAWKNPTTEAPATAPVTPEAGPVPTVPAATPPAPQPAAAAVPEATTQEAQAAAAEVQAVTDAARKEALDKQLIKDHGASPELLSQLNLQQTQNYLDGLQEQTTATPPAPAVVTKPAKAETTKKPLSAGQKRKQHVQTYLKALLNQGPSTGPAEEAIRADPYFNDARAQIASGKITTPEQLDTYLTTRAQEAKAPVTTSENVILSAALGLRSTKATAVQTRKLARVLVDELKAKGISDADAKRMTFAQAKHALNELSDIPSEKPKKKTAKKATKKVEKKPIKKKGETPPPKREAPAQQAAGAAENSANEKPQPNPKNQPDINEPIDVETRVSGILSESPILKDIEEEIVLAVVNEDATELSHILHGLRDMGDITKEQSRAIAELIQYKKRSGQETLAPVNDEIADPASLADRVDVWDTLDQAARRQKDGGNVMVLPRLKRTIKNFLSGKFDEGDVLTEINNLRADLEDRALAKKFERAGMDRVRGVDWFEERLSRALRTGELTKEFVDFTRWLIRKNPKLVATAGFSIKKLGGVNKGVYNVQNRIINIATDAKVTTGTGVHEILHHTERMMPPEIREGIHRAYELALLRAIKNAVDPKVLNYLNTALELHVSGYADKAVQQKVLQKALVAAAKTSEGFAHEGLYQYFNASEFWATRGPVILQQRMQAEQGNWIAKAKQWLSEFLTKLRAVIGKGNGNEAIIAGLDSVIKGDGEFVSKNLLTSGTKSLAELSLPDKAELKDKAKQYMNASKRNYHVFMENLVDRTFGLEKEMARVITAGGKVTPETNLVHAMIRFDGLKNDRLSTDESSVNTGVYTWFTDNWASIAGTRKEAVETVNKFLYNTHILERTKVLWLLRGKLLAGKGYDREVILRKMRDGDMPPAEARKKLERLMASHAEQNEHAYAAKHIENYDEVLSQLEALKNDGIHTGTMQPLNELLQRVRDRTLARNLESGRVSEDDPWIKFYDFKWYVPLKGTKGADANTLLSDLDQEGALGRQSLARLNKQIEVMGGSRKAAANPLEQLLLDLSLAGRRSAEHDFSRTLYDFVKANKKLTGGVISVFEGRPKDGYRQISGPKKKVKGKNKEKEFFRKLPMPPDGFIFHDGERHYMVQLPQDSLLLRGILGIGAEVEPGWFAKGAGKATNFLSKLYTTANPIWQTVVALPRDLTYMPLMMAITEEMNPVKGTLLMGRYMKALASNVFSPSTVPAAVDTIINNRDDLDRIAVEDPDGQAGWLRRYEKAGGSTNFHAWANVEVMGNKLSGGFRNADGVWEVTKPWRTYEKLTSNYASVLENIGRVAAFRTLVESGMTDAEAAAKVKGYLNYDQKGRYSRKVNSFIAFFKVGMTGADAIRKVFTKPDGSFDRKRLATWLPFFMVIGAAKYFLDRELLGDDEDGVKHLKKISLDTLTQKSIFKLGDKTWGFAYGLGLPQILLSPGVVAAAVMAGDKTPEEGARALYEMIGRNAPVRPAGLPEDWGMSDLVNAWTVGSLTPTAIAPIIGVKQNVDAFGRSIHTGFPQQGKFRSEQIKPNTPEQWGDLATFLREKLGLDYYPEDIRYLVRNYGGQPASTVMRLTVDADADMQQGQGAMTTAGRVTAAQVTDEKFYLNNELRNTLDSLESTVKRANALKNKAKREGTDEALALRKFTAATPGADARIAAHKALSAARKQYYADIREIKANKLLSDVRRQLLRKRAESKLRVALEKAKKVAPE